MQRDTNGIASYRPPNRIVQRDPGDLLDRKRTITAGQIAARCGVTEEVVVRMLKAMNIAPAEWHAPTHGGSEYDLDALRRVRVELRYGGKR